MLFCKIIIRHLFCYTIKWNSYMKMNVKYDSLPNSCFHWYCVIVLIFYRVHLFDRSDVFRPGSSVSLIGQSRDNTSGSPCVVCRQTDRRTDRRTDGQQSFCIILSGNSPHYRFTLEHNATEGGELKLHTLLQGGVDGSDCCF